MYKKKKKNDFVINYQTFFKKKLPAVRAEV